MKIGNFVIKIKKLRAAIEEGEKSGMVKDFDPKKHLQSLHERYL